MLARRRRALGLLLLPGGALAADASLPRLANPGPDAGVALPGVQVGADGFSGAAALHWAGTTAQATWSDGSREDLVANLVSLELSAGHSFRQQVRVEALLPLHAATSGGTPVGDLSLAGHLLLGEALAGRAVLSLPTGDEAAWLGRSGPAVDLLLTGALPAGPARLSGLLGTSFAAAEDLAGIPAGSALLAGLGAAAALGTLDVGAELLARLGLGTSLLAAPQDQPLELILHAGGRPHGWSVKGFAGVGLLDGFGAPDVRLGAVIGAGPRAAAPQVELVEPEPVASQPSLGHVKVLARTADGGAVDATVRFDGPGAAQWRSLGPDGVDELDLPFGSYRVFVSAPELGVTARDLLLVRGMAESVVLEIVLMAGRVKLTEREIVILDPVHFAFDSAEVSPDSYALLDEVAAMLLANPAIRRVEIQGHTDDSGKDVYNLRLSQRRVESVMQRLLHAGVEPARLVARGYGESAPIAPNDSEADRARNRRVQFVILETD